MRYYPVFLDLLERPCLVIGQGQLADEKVAQLKQAGAHVLRNSHFDKTQAKQALYIIEKRMSYGQTTRTDNLEI